MPNYYVYFLGKDGKWHLYWDEPRTRLEDAGSYANGCGVKNGLDMTQIKIIDYAGTPPKTVNEEFFKQAKDIRDINQAKKAGGIQF